MPDEDNLQVKELLVAIPFLGSAIAVAYDVGFFYGIDIHLFTLFSITEHITFALEALPFAMVIAGGALTAMRHTSPQPVQRQKSPSLLVKIVAWTALAGVGALLIGLLIYLLSQTSFWFLAAGFVIFLLGVRTLNTNNITGVYLWGSFCSLVVALAMLFGVDLGRISLADDMPTHTIRTTDGLLEVQLIRSGERGVLIHDPKTKQLTLIRWDVIQRITYQRKD
jgi:hypothetical protein